MIRARGHFLGARRTRTPACPHLHSWSGFVTCAVASPASLAPTPDIPSSTMAPSVRVRPSDHRIAHFRSSAAKKSVRSVWKEASLRNGEEISGFAQRMEKSKLPRFHFVVSLYVRGPGHARLDLHRDRDLGGECEGGGDPGGRKPQGGKIWRSGQDDHSICVCIRKTVQVVQDWTLAAQAKGNYLMPTVFLDTLQLRRTRPRSRRRVTPLTSSCSAGHAPSRRSSASCRSVARRGGKGARTSSRPDRSSP